VSSFREEATRLKTAVMYGAGNIGRGFLGQLLSESGYEVVFVDVDDAVVARLNADRAYPVRIVSNAGARERMIRNVRAVHGRDRDGVAAAIAGADLMATAVGVNALPHVAGPLAAGLRARWAAGNAAPLDIIICENLIDANRYLKRLVGEALPEPERPWLDARVGFVEASIGRMVPVMTPEMQEGNPLRVWVEEYAELPVDRDGFRGPIPPVRDLVPFSPFGFYIHRKLFIHNMGHALVAYLGQPRGYRYVWETVADADILRVARAAMTESARALAAEHGVALEGLTAHIEDLLARFANRQLGDTLDRVGRDLSRKLARDDRMIGALRCCLRNGIQPVNVCLGIAAALRFQDPVPGPLSLQRRTGGPEEILERVCQITPGSWEWEQILSGYRAMVTAGA
jgi:mannitol-1-phosphate 5-dehydrogenase